MLRVKPLRFKLILKTSYLRSRGSCSSTAHNAGLNRLHIEYDFIVIDGGSSNLLIFELRLLYKTTLGQMMELNHFVMRRVWTFFTLIYPVCMTTSILAGTLTTAGRFQITLLSLISVPSMGLWCANGQVKKRPYFQASSKMRRTQLRKYIE